MSTLKAQIKPKVQYVQVDDGKQTSWVCNPDEMKLSNDPGAAISLHPRQAWKVYLKMIENGYKGLSLTSVTPRKPPKRIHHVKSFSCIVAA